MWEVSAVVNCAESTQNIGQNVAHQITVNAMEEGGQKLLVGRKEWTQMDYTKELSADETKIDKDKIHQKQQKERTGR